MKDYLLGFGLPDEEMPDWERYSYTDILRKYFPHLLGGKSPRTCPVCGEYHYMPDSFASGTTQTNEEYWQMLKQICEANRHNNRFGQLGRHMWEI